MCEDNLKKEYLKVHKRKKMHDNQSKVTLYYAEDKLMFLKICPYVSLKNANY